MYKQKACFDGALPSKHTFVFAYKYIIFQTCLNLDYEVVLLHQLLF